MSENENAGAAGNAGSFHVNGRIVEAEAGTTIERFVRELDAQGWKIDRITVDGSPVERTAIADLGTSFDEAHFDAAPPEAGDTTAVVAELRRALPRFAPLAEELGTSFARGEWRAKLPVLQQFLDELSVCVEGLSLAGGSAPEDLDALPPLVEAIVEGIEAQSWIEVSDALTYEIAPLVRQWAGEPESEADPA